MELAVQQVFCNVLWVGCLSGTPIILVLNCGFDVQTATDAKHSLLIHIHLVVVGQIIFDPAVALIRTFFMDLLHNL